MSERFDKIQSDPTRGPILVVDDDPSLAALVGRWLSEAGYEVEVLSDGESCLEALKRVVPGVVCLDLELPGISGLETLQKLKSRHTHLPVIILTAHDDVETIVSTMREGAYEYLVKPIDKMKLLTQVRNALERSRMGLRLQCLEREARGKTHPGLVGESECMKHLFRRIDQVATFEVTVLVHGESGTGKELVARAIHAASERRNGPFVGLNCAAIPESLQESELFGHEKGAFTGATERRPGRFELADGGTLFLDEIGELSASAQAKLLRVLQEQTFHRIGGVKEIRSDFRVVAATHRNLREEVIHGNFREDLFYRIAVFELPIPPLRERGDDVLLLANRFVREFGEKTGRSDLRISPAAARVLAEHEWRGNIRELQNAIQHALIVASGDSIRPGDLSASVRRGRTSEFLPRRAPELQPETGPEAIDSWEEMERRTLEAALARANGNITEATRRLGIGRTTFYRKLKKYDLR